MWPDMGNEIRRFAPAWNRNPGAANRRGELLDVHHLSVASQHLDDRLRKTWFLTVNGEVWLFGNDWN